MPGSHHSALPSAWQPAQQQQQQQQQQSMALVTFGALSMPASCSQGAKLWAALHTMFASDKLSLTVNSDQL
jgi:hypothetical protein